ncbi:hypothetical protein D3C79_903130 [compost metagenome]
MQKQCTTGKERRVKRWEHEAVVDAMQVRLEHDPAMMRVRRQTVEHPFGTLKYWMGSTLPDQNPTEGKHRDEPSCARLQPQTNDEHLRHRRVT